LAYARKTDLIGIQPLLGYPQVYKAVLRDTGAQVAVKVQRPGVEPIIFRDLFIFRLLAWFVTPFALRRLGCNAGAVQGLTV
jgi:ABC1 atypical kinase-like domain